MRYLLIKHVYGNKIKGAFAPLLCFLFVSANVVSPPLCRANFPSALTFFAPFYPRRCLGLLSVALTALLFLAPVYPRRCLGLTSYAPCFPLRYFAPHSERSFQSLHYTSHYSNMVLIHSTIILCQHLHCVSYHYNSCSG